MTRVLLWLGLVLLLPCVLFAQDAQQEAHAEDSERAIPLSYRVKTYQIALEELRNRESNLELVEAQRKSLAKLAKDYRRTVQSSMDLEITESNALWLRTMDKWEERLRDILLPHQRAELRRMVFQKLAQDNGGDVVLMLTSYFPKRFKLNDTQIKQILRIRTSAAKQIAKANQEFQEKLTRIAVEAEADVNESLTPKQLKLLTELSEQLKR